MLDIAKLKQHLIDSGAVDRERIDRAQKYAFEENIPLGEALVALNVLSYRRLGQAFSEVYELPYAAVLTNPPPEEAKGLLAAKAAVRWRTIPAAYDRDEQLLTLAIHDPDQIPKLEKIFRFYLQPHSLGFAICSKVELDKAQETFYGIERPQTALDAEKKQRERAEKHRLAGLHKPGETPKPPDGVPQPAGSAGPPPSEKPAGSPAEGKPPEVLPPGLSKPFKSAFSFKAPPRPASASSLQTQGEAPPAASPRSLTSKSAVPVPAYPEMSQAVLSGAALLVRQHFASDSVKLLQAQSRVRYCQLLASRLGLPAVQLDSLILAAWISSMPNPKDLLKEFLTPYKLDEILLADAASGDTVRPEAQILDLVRCYQDLQQKEPESIRDVNLARRNLRTAWSSAGQRQAMLETFLQVLMDEQFLAKLGRTTGRILIVDPAEAAAAQLTPPLVNDGYEVLVAPDASVAEEKIAEKRPDACIVAMNLPHVSGLKFCQKIKAANRTGSIPFIILMEQQDEKRAAECLRAGADEVLSKPVDLELLFLKLQRLVKPQAAEQDRSGVKGSLGDMGFTDMIQILCASNRSSEIVLTQGTREGHVYIENGRIVHSAVEDKEGEPAFYELMLWKQGEFTTVQCDKFPKRTIRTSTMGLLMEGTRLADEVGDAAEA